MLWYDVFRSATPTLVEPRVTLMKEALRAIPPRHLLLHCNIFNFDIKLKFTHLLLLYFILSLSNYTYTNIYIASLRDDYSKFIARNDVFIIV